MSEVVRRQYDGNPEREWERLVRDPYHRLEFIITMHFLDKYLPKNGVVLDAGGGPGRYTIELAKKDYDMILLDLSPNCLQIATREIRKANVKGKVKKIVEGSITDLSEFENESFDAVLCLGGALSHLLEKREREIAASELIRITKKNAPIFVSVLSRFGVFRTILERPQIHDELTDPSHKELFLQGIHRAEWHPNLSFSIEAYFFHPTELKTLFESHNVQTLEMATCEGLSSHLREQTNKIYEDKDKWNFWVELLLRTCTDPVILGLGEHFLYIGKKRLVEKKAD